MVKQIRDIFANMIFGNSIKELDMGDPKYKTYVYNQSDEYGVCFPISDTVRINERFNIAIYRTSVLKIRDVSQNMLMLGCKNANYKNEFASICADFIRLGKNNTYRESILENPNTWFEKWRDLIGNRKTTLMVYDIIGELLSLKYLFTIGKKPKWNSINMGTHDIECFDCSYEVKSTEKKTNKEITINSPHQLEKDNGKDLSLIYCIFEESELGISIEEVVQQLIDYGMNANELSMYLESRGYNKGKAEYKKKYLLRDMLIYKVDETFPKLTFENFVDGVLPKGVLYYSYTVELSDLDCVNVTNLI